MYVREAARISAAVLLMVYFFGEPFKLAVRRLTKITFGSEFAYRLWYEGSDNLYDKTAALYQFWIEQFATGEDALVHLELALLSLVIQASAAYLVIDLLLALKKVDSASETYSRLTDNFLHNESMQEGSDFHEGVLPGPQVMVYSVSNDGQSRFRGQATRISDDLNGRSRFVVPTHVVMHRPDGTFDARSLRLMKGEAIITPKSVIELKGVEDMSVLITGSCSQLGAKVAKPVPLTRKVSGHVSAVGVDKGDRRKILTSFGDIGEGISFGSVSYSGSTMPGFSGAGYFSGNDWLGTHRGSACGRNLGVASTLVQTLADRATGAFANESSETWAIKSAFHQSGRKKIKANKTGSPHEYQVNVGGKFYIVDLDDIDEEVLQYLTFEDHEVKVSGEAGSEPLNFQGKPRRVEPLVLGRADLQGSYLQDPQISARRKFEETVRADQRKFVSYRDEIEAVLADLRMDQKWSLVRGTESAAGLSVKQTYLESLLRRVKEMNALWTSVLNAASKLTASEAEAVKRSRRARNKANRRMRESGSMPVVDPDFKKQHEDKIAQFQEQLFQMTAQADAMGLEMDEMQAPEEDLAEEAALSSSESTVSDNSQELGNSRRTNNDLSRLQSQITALSETVNLLVRTVGDFSVPQMATNGPLTTSPMSKPLSAFTPEGVNKPKLTNSQRKKLRLLRKRERACEQQ